MNGTQSGALLQVRDLHVHYGKSHILHGVTFQVGKGEVVSLLGRNGSGRMFLSQRLGFQAHRGFALRNPCQPRNTAGSR